MRQGGTGEGSLVAKSPVRPVGCGWFDSGDGGREPPSGWKERDERWPGGGSLDVGRWMVPAERGDLTTSPGYVISE